MTLIVGILCDSGVAIASDRQSTSSVFLPLARPQSLQTSTNSVTKVTKIGHDTLLGVSGTPSIGDEYEQIIKPHQPRFANKTYVDAVAPFKDLIRANISKHTETAKHLVAVIGQERAYSQAICECLMAAGFKDGARLVQIQTHGGFDVATNELPFRVIGSGQFHADPFMAFLRNTFWPNRLPTVDEGTLAAIWAIDYAIEVGAPGVGKGVNVYSVAKEGGKFRTKEATDDQIRGNRDYIRNAIDQLRKVGDLSNTTPKEAEEVPTLKSGRP